MRLNHVSRYIKRGFHQGNPGYAGQDLPEPPDLLGPTGPEGSRIRGWPLEILKGRFLRRPRAYAPPALDVTGKTPDQARRATYQKFVKDVLRTVAGLNDNVGRLLDYLDRTGLAENTVVIYTSDQGYFLGEHNLFDKRLMLEESLRMPFVIRYPKEIKAGTVLDDIVLNIDFAELFLDYADAAVPATMQGRSFRANLRGLTPADWRDAMYYHYWTHQDARPSHYGIRTHRYKLVYYYGLIRMGRSPEQCWELYDLKKDPQELKNRYDRAEYAPAIAQLKRRLGELRQQYRDASDPLKASTKRGGKAGTSRGRVRKRS